MDIAEDSDVASASVDPWDEILERYSFNVQPELCLKVQKRAGNFLMGANCFWRDPRKRWMFVVKPAQRGSHPWLHKVTLSPDESRVRFSTAKRSIHSWLHYQFIADYNWRSNKPALHWRVTTKWAKRAGQVQGKERVFLTEDIELRPHWRISLNMPEVEGHFGASDEAEEGVQMDQGFCHISVPRVELVASVDNAAARWRSMRRALGWSSDAKVKEVEDMAQTLDRDDAAASVSTTGAIDGVQDSRPATPLIASAAPNSMSPAHNLFIPPPGATSGDPAKGSSRPLAEDSNAQRFPFWRGCLRALKGQ